MPNITLPDGSQRSYDQPVTPATIAADIGPGLAKAALIAVVDDAEWDLTRPIENDARLSLVTAKDEQALALLRHDCAHVMAEAVLELFPETQVTIGPAIENGFYYDFHRETAFSEDDLVTIEKRMHDIVERNEPIIRNVWTRDEAVAFYKKNNEPFKIELVEAIPADQTVTFYQQGDFIDLCRGPHLPSTGKLGHAFKLMKVAGAYWRGDSTRPMLQRIYGTAWVTEKDLAAYLHMLEEAEKRDHRKLGRQLGLFHLQEEAAGSVFWHAKGWVLYREIEAYVRRRLDAAGYSEVKTPQLVDRSLWEASGHWEKFGENMFTAQSEDERTLALKPMNCPCHVQIFRQGIKSYRDLPLRMAEFGSCHRNEPSGALHGIMRVRAFTQDDAHIFCTEDQITAESVKFCSLLQSIYADFGFKNSSDEDSIKYVKIFTFATKEFIDNLISEHSEVPHERKLQKFISEEITKMVHSEEDLIKVKNASSILFGNNTSENLSNIDEGTFLDVFSGVPNIELNKSYFNESEIIEDLLDKTNFFSSKSEIRRLISQNSISINKIKIDSTFKISDIELINNKYVLVQKGKKNYYLISVSS